MHPSLNISPLSYLNASISKACSRGNQWEPPLQLLSEMQRDLKWTVRDGKFLPKIWVYLFDTFWHHPGFRFQLVWKHQLMRCIAIGASELVSQIPCEALVRRSGRAANCIISKNCTHHFGLHQPESFCTEIHQFFYTHARMTLSQCQLFFSFQATLLRCAFFFVGKTMLCRCPPADFPSNQQHRFRRDSFIQMPISSAPLSPLVPWVRPLGTMTVSGWCHILW